MDTLFTLIEAAGIDMAPATAKGEIIDSNTSISKPSAWLLDALGGGSKTAAGIRVTPDSAMRQATVFACVNLLSDVESMLPLKMLRRMGDGSKEPTPTHPLYRLLHDAPNDYQSAERGKRKEERLEAQRESREEKAGEQTPPLRASPRLRAWVCPRPFCAPIVYRPS